MNPEAYILTGTLITAGLGAASMVVVALINRVVNRQGDRSSTEHAATMGRLISIEAKVDGVGNKVEHHLGWHEGVEVTDGN